MVHEYSVSVILPCYNDAPLIVGAIQSVLAQTFPVREILVIDDGSSDNTKDVILQFGDRIRYFRQEHRGVAHARNLGLRNAVGELVAFIDTDDRWYFRKLEVQCRYLEKDSSLAMIGTDQSYSFDFQSVVIPQGEVSPTVVPFQDLIVKNRFLNSSIVIRKEVLESTGEFSTSIPLSSDYEYWLRVAEFFKVANVPLPLTSRIRSWNTFSSHPEKAFSCGLQIIKGLEDRGHWRGHRLLKQKAKALLWYSSSLLNDEAGNRGKAFLCLFFSCLNYPLPFKCGDTRNHFARLRRFVALARGNVHERIVAKRLETR